ncbi:Gfo/Idh/MocA family protein [Flammeovirga kamogawensis]|uniref:Gfo/Idh/MocA family oxidoreductase n=1 Tax=Flammeovirga kamogawensis TaxID=373891 RepID=A0ABX8H1G5_9BACT|nr:Gfo/Idh/MocA family oxidoreductase [Flammeovirga kamogawensis]MBB6463308.1 putative dehydrogenase [Flammeovirga kamogawensis]QWG09543.1 gfo/Idh/MocA family oxidoreductase [Flammeovirga kamogawensis]TRX65057.1 Gfo/Idh/MocA family oxidoreductase [Flammeovirga kamogawensis]
MNTIKLGIIGAGYRGSIHLENCLQREDISIEIVIEPSLVNQQKAIALFQKYNKKLPTFYNSDYTLLFKDIILDAVIISVPWDVFPEVAKYVLQFPIYVGIEAASAQNMELLFDLKTTQEKSGATCMILENTCFHRDVMAVQNMIDQGLFGELIHCRGGYEHDLRSIKFDKNMNYGNGVEGEASWRTHHSTFRNGDLYPTHGIGPIASLLKINKGNRFTSIVSHATKAVGLKSYVEQNKGVNHPNATNKYTLGDVVTSTLTTANGETIVLTHNTNLPRPYSLGFRVQGTKGIWIQEHGNHLHLQDKCVADEWIEKPYQVFNAFDATCWKKGQYKAAKTARHQMDYFVLDEFISATVEKRKPKYDLYDMLTWLAISPLSELSINQNNKTIPFPDFTDGNWKQDEQKMTTVTSNK